VYTDGGPQALEIVGSDGRIYTVTKAEVQAFYQSTSGNAASRRAQVIDFIKTGIVAALGPEQIDILELDYDFSTVDGRITTARIGPI
jgi:hypothetical protein